jgi:hypothetical protein
MYPTQQTNKLEAFSAIIDYFGMSIFRVSKSRNRIGRKSADFLVSKKDITPSSE